MVATPNPAAIFVGREEEQQLYQRMLSGSNFWTLLFTGMGGVGKTTLLWQLMGITPPEVAKVRLDFANETLRVDALKILEELAVQLAHQCRKEASTNFRQKVQQARDDLGRISLPETSVQIIRSGNDNQISDISFSMGDEQRLLLEKRRQWRELVAGAFYELVETLSSKKLVVMLDTCEWLAEPENREIAGWLLNDLLPTLHTRLRWEQSSCFVVLASRVPLYLEGINQQDLYSHSLKMLAEGDVDSYLLQAGMTDSVLRQRVFTVTHGHALCVSLIATTWRERGNQPFTLNDLPLLQGEWTERALLTFVSERILKRLSKPYWELTRYGALLRRFDLPLLRAVFSELLADEKALEIFNHLRNYPHIEWRGNGSYAFHDLLREILAHEILVQEPEKWQLYHQRAKEYFEKAKSNLPEYYYHALALDEGQVMDEWWEAVEYLRNHSEQELWSLLLQAAHDSTLELQPDSQAHRAFQQALFHKYNYQMSETLQQCDIARDFYKQVGSKLGEANVLQARGDVQQFRKDMKAALESYKEALELFRQVGDRLGEANVLKARGDVQQFRDEREAAFLVVRSVRWITVEIGGGWLYFVCKEKDIPNPEIQRRDL